MTRTTLAALGILFALSAYIYWFETDPLPDAGESGELVFDVAEEDVERVEIRSRDGEAVALSRREGRFWLAEPLEARASEAEVDRLLQNLASMRFEREVATLAGEADASAYGLDEPVVEVRFRTAGGEEHGLALGAETPTGTNRYARRAGEDAVLVAASYLSGHFDVTPWDLRDKAVFPLDEDEEVKPARLVIERAGESRIVLETKESLQPERSASRRRVAEREALPPSAASPSSGGLGRGRTATDAGPQRTEDDVWFLTEPFRARADRYEASDRFSSLRELEMQSLVSETYEPAELSAYGLDPAAYRIRGAFAGEREDGLELHVGNEAGPDYYARTTSRRQLFLVDGGFVETLAKPPAELVSRRLFHFLASDVSRLRIAARRYGSERVIEKRQGGGNGDDVWRESGPDPRDVPASLVEDLLYELSGTSGREVLTRPPVSRKDARLRITVETDVTEGGADTGARREERIAVVAPELGGDDEVGRETVYVFRDDEDVALALEASSWSPIESMLSLTADENPP